MSTATIGRARVDGVLVVDTPAGCVAFNDLYTHDCRIDSVDVSVLVLLRSTSDVFVLFVNWDNACVSERKKGQCDEGKILDSSLRWQAMKE